VVACDIKEERKALVTGPEYGYQRFTTDFEKVVAAADVDLVLRPPRCSEHGIVARAALEAGKHVLVEKPMASTLEEAAALVELARTSKGFLIPAPHVLLSPTYQKCGAISTTATSAPPIWPAAFYGWSGPNWGKWCLPARRWLDVRPRRLQHCQPDRLPRPSPTGLRLDRHRHPNSALVEGELMEVQTDDNVHLCIEFAHNCYAVVTTGFTIQRYRTPAIEIYGSKGTIQNRRRRLGPRRLRALAK
jgi:predicted dehydrogenase